jgi:hypothetical protein
LKKNLITAIVFGFLVFGCGSDEHSEVVVNKTDTTVVETAEDVGEVRMDLAAGAETQWNNCTANWVARLDTNPLTPQWYSGDTHAAYGVFAFRANRRNRYVFKFKGRVPDARFFSYESYEGPLMALGDHIFDHQMLGTSSGQPASLSAGQGYGLLVYPPEDSGRPVARIPGYSRMELTRSKVRRTIKSVMFRVYAPKGQKQVTLADFPQVYAYDPQTGRPKACPRVHNFKPFDMPQQIVTAMRGMKTSRTLDFGSPPGWFGGLGLGTNTAVKDYVINTTRMDDPNDIAVVRFRAPYFSKQLSDKTYTPGHTRYWSFCFPNFAENTTLSCLPDYVAEKDQGKMITIVYGKRNPQVEYAAEQAGYYFMEDTRRQAIRPKDIQRVNAFVYRNMMTTPEFDSYSYQGDYRPRGKVCTTQQFLNPSIRSGSCL